MNTQTQEALQEKTLADAPSIYTNEQGQAWANGYNDCLEALEAEQVCQAQEPEFDLKDLACSAHEEAMSFGLDRNLFERYFKKIANLYTYPHQWQGLTDDEINEILEKTPYIEYGSWIEFAQDIEQELKTKNGFSDIKEKNT
jgi:hypothetical protein